MNTYLKSTRRIASVPLLSIGLTSGASAQTAPPPGLMQQIEAAHTRLHYEAQATDSERQAAATLTVAVEHLEMAKIYLAKFGRRKAGANTSAHHNAIAEKSKDFESTTRALP